jgi:UDP-N-acetylglucosamine transferase subunit ALG13
MAQYSQAKRAPLLGIRPMIFVTVGSMMPFDRLIFNMDMWTRAHTDQDVLAQIGQGSYVPKNMRWTRMLSPSDFRSAVSDALIIVAHAGMGSFFTAMEIHKPIVMLPRMAANREHTTDHQLHTLQWLRQKMGVYAAMSEEELARAIDQALSDGKDATADFNRFAPEPLLTNIRQFLTQ